MKVNVDTIISLFKQPTLMSSYSPSEQSIIIIVLRQQNILARFAYLALEHDAINSIHEKAQRHLRNAIKKSERQVYQVGIESQEITKTLAPYSDYVVFLKGAAYSLSGRLVGKGRLYSDIDILVTKTQLRDCEQALVIAGWLGQEITNYDDKYYRKWTHEIPPLIHTGRGTVIDVHHNILPIVSKDAPTVEALAAHVVSTPDGVQVLSDSAQFVHSAVHLFRNEEYLTAFRDLLDLYLMLIEKSNHEQDVFIQNIVDVAKELGLSYEVGLAFDSLKRIMGSNISQRLIDDCLHKSAARIAFDRYLFQDLLRPQHELLVGSLTPMKHLLATVRGHCIKMPLHLLVYHLSAKSLRGLAESIFGKHIFTPKDEENNLGEANN